MLKYNDSFRQHQWGGYLVQSIVPRIYPQNYSLPEEHVALHEAKNKTTDQRNWIINDNRNYSFCDRVQ